MTKSEYIETFVINFISVWTARSYCSRGLHKDLENPPFEDAVFLATRTWEKFERFASAAVGQADPLLGPIHAYLTRLKP